MFSSVAQTLESIKQQFAPMHYQFPKKYVYTDGGIYFAIDFDNYETPIQLGPEPNIPSVFHACYMRDIDPEECPF